MDLSNRPYLSGFRRTPEQATPAVSESLDSITPADSDVAQQSMDNMKPPKKPRSPWVRIGGLAAILIGVILGIFLVSHGIAANKKQAELDANAGQLSAKIKQQSIQLPNISSTLAAESKLSQSALTVNGQVNVASSMVLQPSEKPTAPVSGQLYYDESANLLEYYNGTQFVDIQGGGGSFTSITNNYAGNTINNFAGNTTNVTNVTNITNGGVASGVGAVNGTAGSIAMFTDPTTLGDSLITEAGNNLSTGNGVENVTLGSSSGASTSVLQAGTGGISLQTGAQPGTSGTITIESGASSTQAAGDINIDTGSSIVTGTVISDRGFEDNTQDNIIDGFGYHDTLSVSNTVAHTGTHSLQVSVGLNPTFQPAWEVADSEPFVTPGIVAGHLYHFSVWVLAGSTSNFIDAYVNWSSTGFNTIETDQFGSGTDNSAGWTQISGNVIAPAGAVNLSLQLNGFSTAVGELHYVDDMTVTDLDSSTSVADLNVGAVNAQRVTLGNANQIGATSIYGGGINLNSGNGNFNVQGGAFQQTTSIANIQTTTGSLNLSSDGAATWQTLEQGGFGQPLTIKTGDANGGSYNGGNIAILAGGGDQNGVGGSITVDNDGFNNTSGTVVDTRDFETGTDNMLAALNDSVFQSNTASKNGNFSLEETSAASGLWKVSQDQAQPGIPVTPGDTYYFSAWVRADAADESVQSYISWLGAGAFQLNSVKEQGIQWMQITGVATVPAGVTQAFWNFEGSDGGNQSNFFDFFNVTDLGTSNGQNELNLGSTFMQGINIGNEQEVEPTNIQGGAGINIDSASSDLSLSGGNVNIQAGPTAGNSNGGSLFLQPGTQGDIVLGTDGTTAPLTVRGGAAVGNNVIGSNLTFDASDGTGVGGSGSIIFSTAGGLSDPQVTVDGTNGAEQSNSDATMTWSHTTGAEADMVLIVAVDTANTIVPSTATNVTYNGVALTELTSAAAGAGQASQANGSVWYMVNPPAGAHNIQVTLAGNTSDVGAQSTTLYNVDTTNPFATFTSNVVNAGNAISTNLSGTDSGEGIFDTLFSRASIGNNVQPGAGQTPLYGQEFFGDANFGSFRQGNPGSTTMAWTGNGAGPLGDVVMALSPEPNVTPDTLNQVLNITQAGTLGVDLNNTENALNTISFGGGANRTIAVNQNPATGNGNSLTLQAGEGAYGGNYNGGNLVLNGGQGSGTGEGGGVIVAPLTDSNNTFEVQNAAATSLLNIDSATLIINDPMTASPPTGTLNDSANWVNGQDVELDTSSGGAATDGEVNYTPTVGNSFDAKFQFNSSNNDGVYFYFNNTSIPLYGYNPNNGYMVSYDFTNGQIYFDYDGTTPAFANVGSMNNGLWHTAEIIRNGNNFKVYFDGNLEINYTDIPRTLTGLDFGIGGFTFATHSGTNLIRDFSLSSGISNGTMTVSAYSQFNSDVNVSGQLSAGSVLSPLVQTNELDTTAGTLGIGTNGASAVQIGNQTSNIATTINGTVVIEPTPGNDSTTAMQILQQSSGSALLTADTKNLILTVSGTPTDFATLTLANAHFSSTQTTPPSIGMATCSGAQTVTAASTDSAGSFSTGTLTAGGTCVITVTFNQPYATAPKSVLLTPMNVAAADTSAAGPDPYVSATSTTTFTVTFKTAVGTGSAYQYYYWVIE